LEIYKLNKEFTRVVSPIDGQVSRYYLTLGNLVNQDQTLLTTVVSLDPMYAYFDMDERTLLQIRRAISEGKITYAEGEDIPLYMGLQGEDGYPHQGTVNFVNNQVNSTTGSITMRGVFANPKLPAPATAKLASPPAAPATATESPGCGGMPPSGATAPAAAGKARAPRLLSPGMFVRIRLPMAEPHRARLIIDRAIQSNQDLKYVYVLDANNRAQMRSITKGALQEDGLREVTGVEPSDWVIVGGLQQVRSRMEVKPERMPMPSLRQPDAEAAQPAGPGPQGTETQGQQEKKKVGAVDKNQG
jgi:multidrug efflux system membrane fusion protein